MYSTFQNCPVLTKVRINAEDVIGLGTSNNEKMSGITVPFQGCTALKTIEVPESLVEDYKATDGWKELSAVKNGRVYTNPYGAFAWDRFGLESYFQMDYALLCIQPELAAENGIDRVSITQEVMDFYKMMNGTELTEEQVGYMIDGLEPDGTEVDPDAAGAGMGQGGGRPG